MLSIVDGTTLKVSAPRAAHGRRVFIACPHDHYIAVVDLKEMKMAARIDAGREPTVWRGGHINTRQSSQP